MELIEYDTIFIKAEELLTKKSRSVIAIDGGACSGKTTLAVELKKRYGAAIIHTDDFFLRPEQRTPERFAEAGGNFDRERFFAEVLLPLSKKENFSYQRFDCHTMTLAEKIEIPSVPLTVIEGSYSHHPLFDGFYDLRIFLSIPAEKQKERIKKRDGEYADVFFSRWIPFENNYFRTFSIEKRANFVISV
ncbi:MAG: phosphoribulokinase [Clostridia bacterium]|nr:phosphoribulokinase [Clostridia bacterium]